MSKIQRAFIFKTVVLLQDYEKLGLLMLGSSPGGSASNGAVEEEKANSFSKELARLQFFGAGPKMAGLPSEKSAKEKTRGIKLNYEYDPVRTIGLSNRVNGRRHQFGFLLF